MKSILVYLLLMVFQFGFSQEVPKVLKTKFSKEALAQKLQDENGKEISINEILKLHKDKILIIDFWAGWCKDCLKAFPKAKEFRCQFRFSFFGKIKRRFFEKSRQIRND